MKTRLSLAAVLIALCAHPPTASLAAGTEDGSADIAPTGSYAEAKALIDAADYAPARDLLTAITAAEPANADAWNLLGFSSRKLGDLTAAATAYSVALSLNPRHLGALEYQGEMFIQMGDATSAKANLATLQTVCGTCEEMRDLQRALVDAGLS